MDWSKMMHFRETDCDCVSSDGWMTAALSHLSGVNLNSREIQSQCVAAAAAAVRATALTNRSA